MTTTEELDAYFGQTKGTMKECDELHGNHTPMLFLLRGAELVIGPILIGHFMESEQTKDILALRVKAAATLGGIDGYALVNEAWMSRPDAARYDSKTALPPSKDPARIEALTLVMVSNAVQPRYARQCAIEVERGKVIEEISDVREAPGLTISGRMAEILA